MKFKQKEFTIKVNESLNLLDQVSVLPENADFKSITWKVASSGFNIKMELVVVILSVYMK